MAYDPAGLSIPSMAVQSAQAAAPVVQLQSPQGSINAPQGGNVDTTLTDNVAMDTLGAIVDTIGGVAAQKLNDRYQSDYLKGWAAAGSKEAFQSIIKEDSPITKIFGGGGYAAGARARQASAQAMLAQEQIANEIPAMIQREEGLDSLIAYQSNVLDSLKTGDQDTDMMLTQQVSEATASLAGRFTTEKVKFNQLQAYDATVASASAAARLFQHTATLAATGQETQGRAEQARTMLQHMLITPPGMDAKAAEDAIKEVYTAALADRSWAALDVIEQSGSIPDDQLNTLLNTRKSIERKITSETLLDNTDGWFDRKLAIISKASVDESISTEEIVAEARKVNDEWRASGMREPIFSTDEIESLQARTLSAELARRERLRAAREKVADKAAEQQLRSKANLLVWEHQNPAVVAGMTNMSVDDFNSMLAFGDESSGIPGYFGLIKSNVPEAMSRAGRLITRAVEQGNINPYLSKVFSQGVLYNGGVLDADFQNSVKIYSSIYNSLADVPGLKPSKDNPNPGALAAKTHKIVASLLGGNEAAATQLQNYYEMVLSNGDEQAAFANTFGRPPAVGDKQRKPFDSAFKEVVGGAISRFFAGPEGARYDFDDESKKEITSYAASSGLNDPVMAIKKVLDNGESFAGKYVQRRSRSQMTLAEETGFQQAPKMFRDLTDLWVQTVAFKQSPKLADGYRVTSTATGDFVLTSTKDYRGIPSVTLRRNEFKKWIDDAGRIEQVKKLEAARPGKVRDRVTDPRARKYLIDQ